MGVRENKVEKYLDDRITQLGGLTRKWTSPGHPGVPDRIVIIGGTVLLVEVKTEDGEYEPSQVREHERLKKVRAPLFTVFGKDGVDLFISTLLKK